MLALLFGVLVAATLCAPRLGLGYFWDDYIFLTSCQANPLSFLLTNPTTIFYRPISMGLYPLLLLALGPWGSVAGHVLNLGLLALSVVLLATLVARIAGFRAGLLAGLTYASLSSVPSLVAWTTASQDLFAIVFILAALHLRHAGRTGWAIAAAACALFSKETAVSLLPALVLWPWLLKRRPYRLVQTGLLCVGLLVVWAAVHPGVHAFLAHGFVRAPTGYVRMEHPERWALHAGQYLLTLFNLPLTGHPTPWPRDLTLPALLALGLLLGALRLGGSGIPREDRPAPASQGRLAALAALLAFPPLVLHTVLVSHWAFYYASLSGIGGALLIGTLLSRARPLLATGFLALYLILGVWCRGVFVPDDLAFTESKFVEASQAIRLVEARFRELHSSFPRGAQLLVSVGQTGTLGIAQTMHQGLAPQIWYGDPTLLVLSPELRRRDARNPPAEYLFRITASLDVIEINPRDGTYRSSGDVSDMGEIVRPLRTYARALAATGEVDRGVAIFRMLETVVQGDLKTLDRRYAAMLLLASGRKEEAARLALGVPDVPRQLALDIIAKLYMDAVPDTTIEEASFPAFGIDPRDLEANRYIMRRVSRAGYWNASLRLARRIQRIRPGDSESLALIRETLARHARDFITVPVMPDSL